MINGNSNQNDVQRIVENHFALERKNQNQCQQQPGDGEGVEFRQERISEKLLTSGTNE